VQVRYPPRSVRRCEFDARKLRGGRPGNQEEAVHARRFNFTDDENHQSDVTAGCMEGVRLTFDPSCVWSAISCHTIAVFIEAYRGINPVEAVRFRAVASGSRSGTGGG